MIKSLTILLTSGLTMAATGQALAQTELNSVPQPGRPPTTAPTPVPAPILAPGNYGPAPDAAPNYRSSLSLELGWGAPYGFGLTYAQHLSPSFDVNGGLGIGVGGKIGVGARYYLAPQKPFSPYLGLNLVRSGRIDHVNIDYNGEQATYSMRPSGVLHLRGGLRWQPGRVGLLSTLGYGARFTGDPVSYDFSNPNPSPQLRDLVQAISPGGIEFSVGLVIGLGR
ncbi:hypothetical protein ACFSX6_11255 [Hymenobacter rubripertinctus]|uniref:hypothetical protein n=1 Tax=Hymenobacter rubripertinctus TaxID=2029981 RepID=UPI00362AEC2B